MEANVSLKNRPAALILIPLSLQYSTTEEASATRDALHRVKWPQSNPKVLNVDFSEQDEVNGINRFISI